jgi:DUF438 domain-containing protein
MKEYSWADHHPAAITVCDQNGIVIYMNQTSQEVFAKDGGMELIGKSLFTCHKPESVEIIKQLLESGKSNTYTIQKGGKKKMVYQTPFFDNGEVAGLVEISFEIPARMPHHNRD